MPNATCPECGGSIELKERPYIGDMVYCPECEEDFEVIGLNPIELDWPWDEDDDDWDDWDD